MIKKNKIFFVYTENKIPSVGSTNPDNLEIGIGAYKNIRAGCVNDSLMLLNISEFNPIPCSEDAARGLSLIGFTELPEEENEPDPIQYNPLSTDELRQQVAANKLINKLEKRFLIKSFAGDDGDLLADLSKKVLILEKIIMEVFNAILPNTNISTSKKDILTNIITDYNSNANDKTTSNQIDNIDIIAELNKLRTRETIINEAANIT